MMQTLVTALVESHRQGPESPELFSTKVLNQLPEDLHYVGWWLYDHNLQTFASVGEADIEPYPVSRLLQIKSSKEQARSVEFPSLLNVFGSSPAYAKIAIPLMKKNHFIGLLEMHFSLQEIRYRLLFSQRLVLIYVGLYGALLIFIGYFLLQRNVMKPASNLLKATEEVGRGNLETRLPVAGPIELSRLAEAYNNMVTALQASRQETQTHIDALEQTNQHLQAAREELIRSEKLASVGQMAAGLAHELGNPLAALIGYLEILKLKDLNADNRDILNRSLVETERIDYLVQELLDFSRPSSSVLEEFEPAAELRQSLALLNNQGVFSNRQLHEIPEVTLPIIRMERQKLQQVFINLMLNAVQATEQSGEIKVTCGAGDQIVWFEIADNGCGMSEADLKHIFDPFFTTKEPGHGTGLGLAICHRIIEESGGTIQVQSEVGSGSRFRIELPIVAV
jgi:signal transduction histidine kinase